MYKSKKKALLNNDMPAFENACMAGFQFHDAKYSDIAFCIQTTIDSGGSYFVVVKEEMEVEKIQKLINGTSDGCASTLTTGKDCASHIIEPKGGHKQMGVLEMSIAASRGRGESNEQKLEVRKDGLTNAITTVQKDNLVLLGWSRDDKGKVNNYHQVDVANCQTSCKRSNTQNYVLDKRVKTVVRIRKLTKRECFRLMGVSDEDISKIQAVCSNTQCYKLAGNSIVVNVLDAIFSNLFFPEKAEKDKQLTLF